jgi:uncharacterized protein (TIGR01244 family)
MGPFLLPDEFATPDGRKAAWRSLWLHDHGFIRKLHRNEHRLSDEMFRSAQPSPLDIQSWADRGIKTIINLRGLRNNPRQPGYWHLAKEAAARAGIVYIDHRAYSREAPKPAFITDLDRVFAEIAYPALLHCKSGADRAGLGSFLYLFLRAGRPFSVAREQLSLRYGHIEGGKTGILDAFLDAYAEAAKLEGEEPNREHFLAWVEGAYDPEALKADFKPKAFGSFLTETLLRRE